MKYVKQDNGPTCGVACYAMLTGITFEKARKKLKKRMNDYGLKTIDMVKALRAVNYKITGSGRLRPSGNRSWNDLPKLTLVKVRPDGCPMRHWHWVVWNGKKVYDPVRGVILPEKYKYDPISFIEIKEKI